MSGLSQLRKRAKAGRTVLVTFTASPIAVPSASSTSVQQHIWYSPLCSVPTKVFLDRPLKELDEVASEVDADAACCLNSVNAAASLRASELMEIALQVNIVAGETVNADRDD